MAVRPVRTKPSPSPTKLPAETQKKQAELRMDQAELPTEQAEHIEKAMRASELNYRPLFEAAKDGILILDVDTGRITDVNPFLFTLLGFPRSEMIGKTVGELSPFKDIESNKVMLERLQKDGYVRYEYLPLETKDGRKIAVEFFSNVYQAGDKKVIQCNIRNITERKRAEEALQESEHQMRLFMQVTADSLWNWDLITGNVVRSVGFNRDFGYSPQEMNSTITWWEERLHPDDRGRVFATFHDTVASGGNTCSYEYRFRRQDGTHAQIHDRACIVRDAKGKPLRALGAMTEITERKRAEKQMQMFSREIITAREEERKQVSSVLHHDVGSLVVGLTAHLDAIEADIRAGKRVEALKWMKRTRKLFDQTVARLKKLAIELRPPELDVLGLSAALRQHFAQVTECGDTRIHFRESLGRRRVSGDTATILFRFAQEALTNAIRHGHATRVAVGLSTSEKEITLTVRNNGKGFNPSEQSERATSQMGLRVMQEMAASGGGAFTIASGRGKRTTVRVSLPLKTAGLGTRDVTVRKETVARGKKTRSAGRGSRTQKGSCA